MPRDGIKVVSPISTGMAQRTSNDPMIDSKNFGSVSGKANGSALVQGPNNILQFAYNVPRTADSAKPAPSTVPAMPKDDVKVVSDV